MVSLLGIAFDRAWYLKAVFYFSFGGINNIVKFDLLHCMLFLSLTVSFGFYMTKLKFIVKYVFDLWKGILRNIKCITPS